MLLCLGFLYLVRGILLPFVVSFIVATLLEPPVRKLRLRGLSRLWAVSVVFAAFFIGVTAVGLLVAPSMVSQVDRLGRKIDDLTTSIARADESSNFYVRWNPVLQAERGGAITQIDAILLPYRDQLERWNLPSSQQQIVAQYIEPRRGQIANAVKVGFNSFFGILGSLASQLLFAILIPIIIWMLLMDMEDFRRRSPRWIPPSIRSQTLALMSEIGGVFTRYLRGVATVIFLYMVTSAILLSLLNVPYAILLGIVFGALYMIPYIGNIISLLVIFLITGMSGVQGTFFLPAFANAWAFAAVATLIYFVFGSVFDHLVYPQLVGNSVGLNGVVSLFVILCGGALFGLVGMLLAFPLAGAAKVILDRLIKVTSITTDSLALPSVPIRHRSSTG